MNLLLNPKWPPDSALKLSRKKERLLHYKRDFFFSMLMIRLVLRNKQLLQLSV